MRGIYRKAAQVWKREDGSWLLLGFLLATLFVIPFFADWFPNLQPVSTGFLVVVIVVGVFVVSRSIWATVGASLLAGTAIALELVREMEGADPFASWRVGTSCLTMALFMAVTLGRAFAPGPVTTHRIVGAITAYLLVGVTWAYAYEWLEITKPGSLSLGTAPGEGAYPAFIYFSFVTLTTVGYGEMTPISQAARALSNIESLIGVLYPAVLIGRLLSKQTQGIPPAGDPPATPPPDAQG
jgi:hypothetical protein